MLVGTSHPYLKLIVEEGEVGEVKFDQGEDGCDTKEEEKVRTEDSVLTMKPKELLTI